MDPTAIWNTSVVNPLVEGLRFLYSIFGSYGIAIIVFTILTRLVMLPLSLQQMKSSKAMQQLQPQVQALQKKYAKEKEKLSQETMKLYQENGVNPLSGCLPTVIQMPIWIGLYSALTLLSTTPEFASGFLWINNLAARPNTENILANLTDFILPVITVLSQFITQKMMTPAVQDPQQQSMNSMMSIMPIMFGFFALQVPAGLVLYWVASNLFSMVQQYFATGWGSLATLFPAALAAKGGQTPTKKAMAPSQGSLDAPRDRLPKPVVSTPDSDTTTTSTSAKTVQRFDQVSEPVSEGKRKPKRGN